MDSARMSTGAAGPQPGELGCAIAYLWPLQELVQTSLSAELPANMEREL